MLELLFYTSHRLSWGVRFAVPKYQAFDSLFVACSAYICDSAVKTSAYCDRSCVPTTTTAQTRRRRRRRRRRLVERRQQLQTEFTVADRGYGPVIDSRGQLRLIPESRQFYISSSLIFLPHTLNSASDHRTNALSD